MAISAKLVKELRDLTGAGMMECKKILVKTEGNLDKALKELKDSGQAKADKKSSRIAAEGLIAIAQNDSQAVMVEINSETDFLARDESFKSFANDVANVALSNKTSDVAVISSSDLNGESVEVARKNLILKIGENMTIRRAYISNKAEHIGAYAHGAKIGVIVELKGGSDDLARNIAMHVAAMNPSVLSFKNFTADFVKNETIGRIEAIKIKNEELERLGKPLKNIPEFISMSQLTAETLIKVEQDLKDELKAEGKPEKIWDKIIPGKLQRFITDNTSLDKEQALLDQFYVMDTAKTVGTLLSENNAEIISFNRLEVGQGIEKAVDDFAAEVMAQAGL